MSITHDIVKINLVKAGYLPNYPYHLISDEEMINAFIFNDINYFDDNYPCVNQSLQSAYQDLKNNIIQELNQYMKDKSHIIPDWVYSYMLGTVISVNSSTPDKHDLLVSLLCDNTDDVFTSQAAARCYDISKKWVAKIPYQTIIANNGDEFRYRRSPTIFGEPHVIKSLRLQSIDYTGDDS